MLFAVSQSNFPSRSVLKPSKSASAAASEATRRAGEPLHVISSKPILTAVNLSTSGSYFLAFALAALLITGCDSLGGSTAPSPVNINGEVVDDSSNPVKNALMTFRFTDASGVEVEKNALTDSLGAFSTTVRLEETTEVTVTAAIEEDSTNKVVQISPDDDVIGDLLFTVEPVSPVSINGRVLDASSNPVEAAQMVFQFTDASEEEVERTTVTDSVGTFSTTVRVKETTEVVISASKAGDSTNKSVQVSPDDDVISDLLFTLGE